jgi:hypothetical protein
MFLRVHEEEGNMAVSMLIPTEKGFAVTYTFKNVDEIHFESYDKAVSPTDSTLLVLKKKNGKMAAIPFDMALIDNDIYDRYKKDIYGDTEKIGMGLANGVKTFMKKDRMEAVINQYSSILEAYKVDNGKVKNLKSETVKVSDKEWEQIRKLVKEKGGKE